MVPSLNLEFGADLASFGATFPWRRKLDEDDEKSSYLFGTVANGAEVLKFGAFTVSRRNSGFHRQINQYQIGRGDVSVPRRFGTVLVQLGAVTKGTVIELRVRRRWAWCRPS
jgi:hypothetical protein